VRGTAAAAAVVEEEDGRGGVSGCVTDSGGGKVASEWVER
jgi:hypothetical protein